MVDIRYADNSKNKSWFVFIDYFGSQPSIGSGYRETFLRIERNKQTETDLRITSIGGFRVSSGEIGHVDLSYIESANDGDGLAMDIGADFSFQAGATFFVGGGLLIGYNWDKKGSIGAYYPEAGIAVNITRKYDVTISGKRYFNLYGNTENVIMIGVLLSDH